MIIIILWEQKKENNMINEDEIYWENLSFLKEVKGEQVQFGESKVDEKYLSLENLFIKSNLYEADDENNNHNICNQNITLKNKISNLCILCHCDKKESVFYPCGHRCTCYKCAVYYFEMYKKCPRCDKFSEAIVPKIYEQFNDCEKKI